MVVFLRRIPANTRKRDIIDFLGPVLKGGLLHKAGHIEDVEILVLNDTQLNIMEYHCLVTIDSDEVANRVIKKLNRKVFKGKHIAVREYFHRSWHNDSRVKMNEWNKQRVNKRHADRRRTTLEVVEESAEFITPSYFR